MIGNNKKEPIDPVIVDWFTRTILPVFSWFLSRLFSAALGYKLTVLLLRPTATYRRRVADTWIEKNWLFSTAEILSFGCASGRRRGRKKLRKLLRPALHEIKRSQEFLVFKRRFHEKWDASKKTIDDKVPAEIPNKARIEIDITEVEKRSKEQVATYSRDDILEAFPMGSTLADDNLKKRVVFEVDGYPETMHGLLWEASHDWNIIRQVQKRISKDSEIWEILGFDPNDEPHLEVLIDWALDFGLGEANKGKLIYLSRWFMDRILISQFVLYPYSDKHFISLQERLADGLTLEDVISDDTVSNPYNLQTELSAEQGKEAILEVFAEKGIGYDDLTPREWAEIFERYDLIRKGYEFSSKIGTSIKSFYGEQAHAKEQKWSRIKQKIRNVSTKPQ